MIRPLYRGGQGVVYLAEQLSTKREVALKVLYDGALAGEARKRKFEREIELVAALKHRHIVPVFDSGINEGRFFYSMECVEGQRLSDYVKSPQMSVNQVLQLFLKICDAVDYAHQRGVIHRDLKPSNILVDQAGEPRVLDFGLAKATGSDDAAGEADEDISISGQIIGTPHYMSPEQAAGLSDQIDLRSDVYTLGVIAFELFTGQSPYELSGSHSDMLAAVQHAAPKRLRSLRPRVGDEIETIVLKAMPKDKSRRYVTAGMLADDLRRALEGLPIEAKRDSTWYVLRKLVGRHKTMLGAAAVFALLLSVSSVVAWMLYARTVTSEAKVQRMAGRGHTFVKFVVFEYLAAIEHLKGATGAKVVLIDRALEYLDGLVRIGQDDDAVMHDIVMAYNKLGEAQLGVGDANGAVGTLQKARHLQASLADDNPIFNHPILNISLTKRLADAYLKQGRTELALDHYQRTLDAFDQLHTRHGTRLDDANARAAVYRQIGKTLDIQGQTQEAIVYFLKARKIVDRMNAKDRVRAVHKVNLVEIYAHLSQAYLRSGELGPAEEVLEKVLPVSERVARSNPRVSAFQIQLAQIYENMGRAIQIAQRPEDARRRYRQAIDILKEHADPDLAGHQNALIRAHNLLGHICRQLNQTDDAPAAYRSAEAVSRKQISVSPIVDAYLYKLAKTLSNVATMQASMHQMDEAGQSLREARTLLQQLIKTDSNNTVYQNKLTDLDQQLTAL